MPVLRTGGPYFDELTRGQVFTAPAYTLTEGRAAVHQAITGDRAVLSVDAGLGQAVLGTASTPAAVAFVLDTAIGQTTVVTRRVKANLFYRGLQLHRLPVLGDTLRTTTEIAALRENRRREGRAPTGLAALRVRTEDQEGRTVLDFVRCAMLPLSEGAGPTGHADDLDTVGSEIDPAAVAALASTWDLDVLRAAVHGPYAAELAVGDRVIVDDGDVVSAAPELARLTVNIAAVHHDRRWSPTGERLVYGGHTIALAAHQAHRALPAVAAICAWTSCDHLGPVFEGDTLTSVIDVEAVDGALVRLRSVVTAHRDESVEVLDWHCTAVMA